MNKLSALALSAVIAAGTPYAIANAQDNSGANAGADASVEAGVDAGMDAGGVDAGAEMDADADADAGMGADANSGMDVEAGMGADSEASDSQAGANGVAAGNANMESDNAADAEVEYSYDDLQTAMTEEWDLSTLNADTTITVVATSELMASENVTYDALLDGESAQAGIISRVQTAIEDNAEITDAVQEEGFEVSEVIALWFEEEGSLVVFVDDLAE